MMNIGAAMKLKGAWDTFTGNHPKFPAFLNAAQNMNIGEDTIIGINIESPDGRRIETNIKLTASDMELVKILKELN